MGLNYISNYWIELYRTAPGNLIMKLWQKNTESLKQVEQFTIGRDREFDLQLAPFDVLGSIAHVKMLAEVGLLSKDEVKKIVSELQTIYKSIRDSRFTIYEEVEDVHSQVELLLTERLGTQEKKFIVQGAEMTRCCWT